MSLINTTPPGISPCLPNFSWTATGPLDTFSVNGDIFPPANSPTVNYALLDIPIPFDATDSGNNGYPKTVAPPGVLITEYQWDFGDGTIAYGPQPSHIFVTAPPDSQVILTVVDNRGYFASIARVVPLLGGLGQTNITPNKIRN